VHFILIKPVLSDHLSYVTLCQCSIGMSHKTGFTIYHFYECDMMFYGTLKSNIDQGQHQYRFYVFHKTSYHTQ